MEILAAKAAADHAFIFAAAGLYFAGMSVIIGWFACAHLVKTFNRAFGDDDGA